MNEKSWKIVRTLLIIGSVLAAIKLIFVDYTLDEEYQIVMAYRRLRGDTMFGTMWEPHQTSAFGCYIMMKLYVMITGTTEGVLVFIRCATALIQAGLSYALYRELTHHVEKRYAFLLGLLYFNYVPKLIQIPEFSNLQLWFFTGAMLAVMAYLRDVGKQRFLILAGICMAFEVLAYPSCLLLFPFLLVFLFLADEKGRRWKGVLLFSGTCAVCGGAWLLLIFSRVQPGEFLENVKRILTFDSTHYLDVSEQVKGAATLGEFGESLLALLICLAVSLAVKLFAKYVIKKEWPYAVLFLMAAEVVQLIYWVVLRKGFERPQILMITAMCTPLFLWKKGIWKEKDNQLLLGGIAGTLVTVAAVLYMSDLGVWNAAAQAIFGAICGIVLWIRTEDKENTKRVWTYLLLVSLVCVFVFGKGFTVKVGKTETNTILGIQNVIRHGPAKGVFTHYMQSFIMNSDYEDFTANVAPDTKCLIVTNKLEAAGTTPYLFGNYEVCHFSIVDPTTYDEKLLTYWEAYPEKRPEVIVVDCWYGELMEEPNSWIMQYIEHSFDYKEVVDGKYVRFYKR